jgi:ankyrin repeat protein
MELFITQGADVNAKDSDGSTALMWAVFHDKLRGLQALISAGGTTALYSAAVSRRDCCFLRALESAGPDVNARDKNGWTVLMRAANDTTQPMVPES